MFVGTLVLRGYFGVAADLSTIPRTTTKTSHTNKRSPASSLINSSAFVREYFSPHFGLNYGRISEIHPSIFPITMELFPNLQDRIPMHN